MECDERSLINKLLSFQLAAEIKTDIMKTNDINIRILRLHESDEVSFISSA